ncbi:hypothetical protein [Stenotrophomonas sp.]|uniref:hypothetical protein n=1 Tax=Stenotrophomonas sp. TaxID=69392 RepID=UPI00289C8B46|nr:hypothetical protein [Stenotrophomonas sp.]
MNIARWTHGVVLLALLGVAPAHAEEGRPGKGLNEIPDPELSLMRGRYTVNGNSVAWFGVTMITQWNSGGQAARSALTLGMDFSHGGTPKISFSPSVTVTAADAPLPVTPGRSIDASGLQNVAGLTQSIQVAGDGNVASNSTHLDVRDGSAPAEGSAGPTLASVQQGGVSAVAQLDGNNARVQVQIDGVGAVQQWIRNGSVGQSIAIGSDGQAVSNRMQIDLVRQSLASNVPLSQNVAQAMTLVRGVGMGPGQ